jgi:hypothetical protein
MHIVQWLPHHISSTKLPSGLFGSSALCEKPWNAAKCYRYVWEAAGITPSAPDDLRCWWGAEKTRSPHSAPRFAPPSSSSRRLPYLSCFAVAAVTISRQSSRSSLHCWDPPRLCRPSPLRSISSSPSSPRPSASRDRALCPRACLDQAHDSFLAPPQLALLFLYRVGRWSCRGSSTKQRCFDSGAVRSGS